MMTNIHADLGGLRINSHSAASGRDRLVATTSKNCARRVSQLRAAPLFFLVRIDPNGLHCEAG